jgi:hypothetical protein
MNIPPVTETTIWENFFLQNSNVLIRQKAMECAASTNPSSANELLATADKVYEWMIQDVKEKTPQ